MEDCKRKIITLTLIQADWLRAEAIRADQSETAVIRRLIRQAMEEQL